MEADGAARGGRGPHRRVLRKSSGPTTELDSQQPLSELPTRSKLTVAVSVEQLWYRVPGGTARATIGVLNGLRSIGQITPEIVVKPFAARHRRSERRRGDQLQAGPVTHSTLPRPVLYESWLRLKRPSVESLLDDPIDVVWAAGLVPPPSSSPVVASVHDVGFLENTERLSRRGRGFLPRVWKVLQDDVAVMVCPSQVVAADLRHHGIDDDRLRVVPLGAAPPLTKPGEEHELIRSLDLPPIFALWVGTVEPRKNLGRLVEAMTTIDDLPLVVVGPVGWNESEGDLLAPLKGRIYRLGMVDDQTLSALYRAATVFVFPSMLEGFGLPVIEAMAHGTPVVTGADTACAEVADGAAILVDVYDPAAIATGIESVVNSQTQREIMRGQGLQRAAQLTWEKAAEGYLDVFVEAAGFTNGRRGGER